MGIVSWNTAALLDRCLESLPAALGDLVAEVVVVDNASSDDSVEVARRHGVELIANSENVGYARAMNQALAGTEADVLIALNPDTVPRPSSLARLAEALRDGPGDVGLVAPRLVNPDGSLQHSVYRFPGPGIYAAAWFVPRSLQRGRLARHLWLEGRAPHDRSQDIDWAIGAVHAIRSSALGPRVGYDERWFMYVEDLELCWWMAQHGWRRRLVTSAEVVHVGNAAGSLAWGGDRSRRHIEAAYDWYRRDLGIGPARRWALVNFFGTLWWSGLRIFSAVAKRQLSDARMALECLSLLPAHLDALKSRNPRS